MAHYYWPRYLQRVTKIPHIIRPILECPSIGSDTITAALAPMVKVNDLRNVSQS